MNKEIIGYTMAHVPFPKKEEMVLDGEIGDVVISTTGGLQVVKADSVGTNTPIGVVVIPRKYATDGKLRIMSLVEMSYLTPETGCKPTSTGEFGSSIYWGGNKIDIKSLINYQSVATKGGYNMGQAYYYWEDGHTNSSATDNNTMPPLFNQDGSLNPDLDTTTKILNNVPQLLSEGMVGNHNTEEIMKLQTVDWSGETLTNNSNAGNYPAACACQRFHTDGTNAGDWYLPSMYELLFVASKTDTIQTTLETLGDNANKMILNQVPYWTSTEYSSTVSWVWYPGNSTFNYGGYKDTYTLVRSFCAL